MDKIINPVGRACVVPKHEPVPGADLLKQRVRVSFNFDVTCNTAPILNSGNDDEINEHDLALLNQFLVTDKQKLLEMFACQVGSELGGNSCFNTGEFEERLFGPAIDQLEGKESEYWQDVRIDWLYLSTEKLFECFSADFVSSSCELVSPPAEVASQDAIISKGEHHVTQV